MTQAKVRPIGRDRAIRSATAQRYGLQVHPFRKSAFAGIVPVEDVWIEAPLDERWLVAYRVVVQDGRAVVAELRVFPNEPNREEPGIWSGEWIGRHAQAPPGGLTTRALRGIRIGQDLHSLSAIVDQIKARPELHWLLDPTHGPYGWFGITDALSTEPLRRPASGRGRPALPPGEYARVAAAYVNAIGRGSRNPIQDVHRELVMPVSTVRSRIHVARKLGLLDRGRQGYAGGQLSPSARKLLKTTTKKGSRDAKATRKTR